MVADRARWNLNIHYHRVIVRAVPPGATTALDVGCGDGLLSFELADMGLRVVGIDPDEPSIDRARSDPGASERTAFVCGDVFTHGLEAHSFDVVASSAMVHHVDARRALARFAELVRPGGVVAIVGFARPAGLRDHALAAAGAATKRLQQIRGRYWEHHAPISWPPPMTTSEMASLGSSELPDSEFRSLMSNRYSLVWQAPN